MNDHHYPHDHHHPLEPTIDRRGLLRAGGLGLGAILLAACGSDGAVTRGTTGVATTATAAGSGNAGAIAALTVLPGFDRFATTVQTFVEGEYWLVESDGMPAHNMMVGITSWQQQVPVPQPYTGANAWRFPTTPVMAATPVSAKTGLFRGAIAIAVNGVPIFNALNNRGDDAYLAGELDQWGGHAGRADDYHYHVAPLHLQELVGVTNPIAYALDGYAIYGGAEPDGSPVAALDDYNGHVGLDGAYHYHGTATYPYINGGLRGVVTVSDQVDPQPTTRPFRPAGEPLRGATITAFESTTPGTYRLGYDVNGAGGAVEYVVHDTTIEFTFTDPVGVVRQESYSR
jgi:YHYH protein